MKFKHKLYPYQQDVLKVFQNELKKGDKRIHIVAPPGSGKTIMGLEMLTKTKGNSLILVPNITLQYQWKDKIEKFFLENSEKTEELISTTTKEIKQINILTYQSLTTADKGHDLILDQIIEKWYKDLKTEFQTKEIFLEYVKTLKDTKTEKYKEKINKYKKKLKTTDNNLIQKILSKKVLTYFQKLKQKNINTIIVDEAHHLTSWWSKVVYYLWEGLGTSETKHFNPNHKTTKNTQTIISKLLETTDKNKYSKIANHPLIIGLTATPPYDDIDFFTLNDDYSKLLGEVDYYIPTPAVVKSGRLAPWSDLVYFVEPGEDLKKTLQKTDKLLNKFLEQHKQEICKYIFNYIENNYDRLINKTYKKLINYLKFIKTYSEIDISTYFFDEKIGEEILLEDIAKTVGKYLFYLEVSPNLPSPQPSAGFNFRIVVQSTPFFTCPLRGEGEGNFKNNEQINKKKTNLQPPFSSKGERNSRNEGENQEQKTIDITQTKKLFYQLGYIWRTKNFHKFRTQIENMLIYSKSKINGIKTILDQEKQNLGKKLKCAIITDYLEDRDSIINCKYILQELKNYKNLNPILVSGQGIWKLSKTGEMQELNTNILEVTKDLEDGKTNLVIGTRGILGEGWDCPKLNTLIDLTGIVAYMSVNQVRGRAIRLDKTNPKKVANVYDIVTYYEGYTKEIDLYRLERKHQKFYGVDDTGLIIRGMQHIYPNIRKNISNSQNPLPLSKGRDSEMGYSKTPPYKKINENMLKRAGLKDYYYKMWKIGGNYQNKEIFGLDLEVKSIGRILPFVKFKLFDNPSFYKILSEKDKLEDITGKNYYYELIFRFLKDFIEAITLSQKELKKLPKNFSFNIIRGKSGNFKIISNHSDELIVKRFIIDLHTIFSDIVDQKYILKYPFAYFNGEKVVKKYVNFGLPDSLCRNKKIRNTLKKFIKKKSLKISFLISGGLFLYLPNIFFKFLRLTRQYKRAKAAGFLNFIYLKGKDNNDRQQYVGKSPFIESVVEKIWV